MKYLIKNKSSIVSKWIELILNSYPEESAGFLKAQKNQFSNPVGYTICNNAEQLFDEIIIGLNFEKIESLLSDIIKIRAVQQFTPSKAVEFILMLKTVIKDELKNVPNEPGNINDLFEIESRIDKSALIAFDLYMKCREKVYQIRLDEVKSNSFRLLAKTD